MQLAANGCWKRENRFSSRMRVLSISQWVFPAPALSRHRRLLDYKERKHMKLGEVVAGIPKEWEGMGDGFDQNTLYACMNIE